LLAAQWLFVCRGWSGRQALAALGSGRTPVYASPGNCARDLTSHGSRFPPCWTSLLCLRPRPNPKRDEEMIRDNHRGCSDGSERLKSQAARHGRGHAMTWIHTTDSC
jgi:hypothetical protein